mgnify:FL=1
MTKKQKKMLYRILAAAVLFLAAKLIPLPALVSAALYFAAYLTVGCDILRKAWKGICNRQVFDENFLMAVATVGAIALIFIIRKYFFVPSFGQKLPGGETAPDMKKAPEECPEADA